MVDIANLKKQSLLEGLTDEELQLIANGLESFTTTQGNAVFHEGGETRGIYLIKSGSVEIKRLLQLDTKTKMLIMLRNISSNEVRHTADGWEHVFARLSAGQFFGELSIIENRKRHSAEAIAREDTDFYLLKKDVFAGFEASHPVMMVKVMRCIAKSSSFNLRQLDKRVFKALIGR